MLDRSAKTCCVTGTSLTLLLMLITDLQAQDFIYTNNNGTITITGYTGPGGSVTIPSLITGLPVTSIDKWAFSYATNLTQRPAVDELSERFLPRPVAVR
jgi:hypothetical protein